MGEACITSKYLITAFERKSPLKKSILAACLVALLLSLVAVGGFFVRGKSSAAHAATPTPSFKNACAAAVVNYARCLAIQAINTGFQPNSGGPAGYHPSDLQLAYNLPSATAGKGQTIAIVDAFDDPKAESDLATYRKTFGLSACTTANGCFKKVNQTGGTTYPAPNAGWATEISLDVDMVSAICPNCHILLVEATTNSFANLGTAVDEAAKLGANAISNSYGGSESASETTIASHYNHKGVAITASSGDNGYGTQAPAAFNTLTAVGGTSLSHSTNARGWKETVWSGAGSGCSAFISKPSWQTDPACKNRTIADVSAVADPNTGVSVYDTYQAGGWAVYGGTSVSSPIIASVYGLAGNASNLVGASHAYSHTTSLYDVRQGSNGSCGGSYLCTGKIGYDGPTGLGTPNGTGAF
jgi:subtilase family serine protease